MIWFVYIIIYILTSIVDTATGIPSFNPKSFAHFNDKYPATEPGDSTLPIFSYFSDNKVPNVAYALFHNDEDGK